MQLTGVDDDGQRRRQSLISAAGVEDDWLFAAVHARVRPRGGPGLRAVLHAVAVGVEQNPADGRAVLPRQSRLGDGGIVCDLARDGLAHIVEVHFVCKGNNILNGQQFAVLGRLGRFLGEGLAEQHLAVALDAHDIRVAADDLDKGRILARVGAHLNIEGAVQRGLRHDDLGRIEVFAQKRQLLLRDACQHLELRVGIADARARRDRNGKALAPARVRNDDALDVFDDVAAHAELNARRIRSQRFARERARISDGDRLGTAHRGHKLFAQDIDISRVKRRIHGHFSYLFFGRSFDAATLLSFIIPKITL